TCDGHGRSSKLQVDHSAALPMRTSSAHRPPYRGPRASFKSGVHRLTQDQRPRPRSCRGEYANSRGSPNPSAILLVSALIFAALRVLYDTVSAWKYLTAVAPCRDICKAAQVDATRRR